MLTLCAACFTLLWAQSAWAAGFYLPGRGVRPMGRAGSFVASGAGNLNSLWYNPANLAGFDGLTLTIDAALLDLSFEHQRAPRTMDNGEVRTYAGVAHDGGPQAIPQILVGGPTGFEGISWSVGGYTPYMSPARFPEDGAQRYVLIDNQGSFMGLLHAALSWQINDRARVGAGIQNFMANYRVVSLASGYVGMFGDPEDEDLDLLVEVTVQDLFSPTANMGAWFSILPGLEAAFALQLPVTIDDNEARARVRMPSHPAYDNATLTNDTLSIVMKMPLIARFGLRLVSERFDVELAAMYEGWSTLDEIVATPNDTYIEGVPGIGAIRLEPLVVPQQMRDTFTLSIGGDFQAGEQLKLRAGYAFDMGAVPDHRISVFIVDADKHMFALGASYAFESFELDFGAAYFLMADRTITNSEVRQINQSDEGGDLALVVGNGTYVSRYLVFGLGVNF
ncbi:MAG: outer membrane protein transport protein [Bradymonadaceae bacterium]|nr:outer membrane protein transport protein [Lujinxingiaceae bacterium]